MSIGFGLFVFNCSLEPQAIKQEIIGRPLKTSQES